MNLKKVVFTICVLSVFYSVQSKNIYDKFYHKFSIGAAMGSGPENLASGLPPKLSLYYYNDSNNNFETYCALEGSIWVLFGFWTSADVLYGIKKDIFTFDTSLGVWYMPYQYMFYSSVGPASYFTINPKFGLKLGWFWLKAGPSLIFSEHSADNFNSYDGFRKIGNVPFNFEFSINVPIYLPDYKKIEYWNKNKNTSPFSL